MSEAALMIESVIGRERLDWPQVCPELACAEFAFPTQSSATRRTTDREHLWMEDSLHGGMEMQTRKHRTTICPMSGKTKRKTLLNQMLETYPSIRIRLREKSLAAEAKLNQNALFTIDQSSGGF
jgi:hypothetical protein